MTPLHVVHAVRSDGFAGVERYICDVASELVGQGHRVRVIGGDPDLMRRFLPAEAAHELARSTREVAARLRRLRPSIVHAHMTAAEAAAVATSPLHRAPVVATRHFARPRGRGPSALPARLVASRLADELSISQFVADRSGGRSVVLHNGVPDRRKRDAPTDPPYVLMMQRLQEEKAPVLGVEAWARSGLADHGWTLRIAGRGPLEGAVRAAAAELGVLGSVELVGFVDDPAELLTGARALLATAPEEPFGLTVVEAMSRGVPVLAARGGAHTETLGGLDWGFRPGHVGEAAAALARLRAVPAAAESMGVALRDRQQALFSLRRHVEGLLRTYDAVRR